MHSNISSPAGNTSGVVQRIPTSSSNGQAGGIGTGIRPTFEYRPGWQDRIPELLRERDQWVLWRYGWRKGKYTKIPYRAHRPGQEASSTDPETWNPFEAAVRAYLRLQGTKDQAAGVGFVFAHGGGLVGFDLDGVILPDGEIDPWGMEHLALLTPTYHERSPSGCGIKGVVLGELPGPGVNKRGLGPGGKFGFEMYDSGRFFTITGEALDDCTTIGDRSGAVLELYRRYKPAPSETNGDTPHGPPAAGDDELLDRARGAKNGPAFASLFDDGSLPARASNSEADFSLCCRLAFWFNRDAAAIDRVFRRSGLMRTKWDDKRGSTTYGAYTIANAIGVTEEVYTPPRPPEVTAKPSANRQAEGDEYKDATPAQLGVIDAEDVEVEDPEWLWVYRFLKRKINLIAGEGGDGKTTIAIKVGAVVTTGGAFPDGSPSGEPGLVMVMAAEDGAGDTIKPRFIAAGADVSRVKFLTARVSIPAKDKRPAMVHPVSLQDVAYWRHIFATYRPKLLVIDPLPAYMGRGINDHKNSEVQAVLNEFANVVRDFDVCVIAITHTGKSVERKLIHKILGSVAYTNVSRVVHVTIRDPDDRTVRYLERPKCNLDEPRDALVYRLIPAEFEHKGKTFRTSKAEFEADAVAIDAEAMANPKSDGRPRRERDAKKEAHAAEWLYDFLDGRAGWTEVRDIFAAAGEAGLIGTYDKVKRRWSSGTKLYRAMDRVPSLDAPRDGKRIDKQDMAAENDRYPRICWRLANANDPF